MSSHDPVEILRRLVAFDTTSHKSNLALIDWVEGYLRALGVKADLVHAASGGKANLIATIGEGREGGIVLSGHTDVVPVDGQAWSSDPWHLAERDGRYYGRGTADMKGFIALALAAVPELLARKLRHPVHLAFSHDEETGCFGVHGIVDFLRRTELRPRAVIVGEPTLMRVVNAQKGVKCYRTVFTGREAHSSAVDKGVNAIAHAAEFVAFMTRVQSELAAGADPACRFDPPYTSVHVGVISGGTALNIIPRECVVTWEIRPVPGPDEKTVEARVLGHIQGELRPRLKALAPEADIVTEQLADVMPLMPEEGSPAETLVMALARQNEAHAVSYATEAGIFQRKLQVSVAICGPGNILDAHRPDEYISKEQFAAGEAFMRRLVAHVAGEHA
ncbi:MAG: acetylornithine deacetylase [Alphaproteobacteria bacterium]|nr:acetylornithine deacetylase [Alphaproteobacteria bacterium]